MRAVDQARSSDAQGAMGFSCGGHASVNQSWTAALGRIRVAFQYWRFARHALAVRDMGEGPDADTHWVLRADPDRPGRDAD
jgi:hypothetical protein